MDLILRQVRIADQAPLVDVGIANGRIAAIERRLDASAPEQIEADGRVLLPGLVESHLHLDKALLADRQPNRSGTLAEAIRVTAEQKSAPHPRGHPEAGRGAAPNGAMPRHHGDPRRDRVRPSCSR